MQTYTVRYKANNAFKWRKIKNVKGDGFTESFTHRFFILNDETRIEIPIINTIFIFNRERNISILERMEEQSGQKIIERKR